MELYLTRVKKLPERTFGELYVEFVFYCHILEDTVREIIGQPVEQWKIPKKTAIPAGRYRVTLENSPKFGPETITINGVKGYAYIRMHGGNDEDDTEGCPLTGYAIDEHGIVAGLSKPAMVNLKRVIKEAIVTRGEEVWINVK